MGHRRLPRRVSDLAERLAALEEHAGPADTTGWTVGDVLDEHPELTGPMVTLWERRHAVHGDLQAAEAAVTIWRTVSGGPFDDRPAHRTEEEPWH